MRIALGNDHAGYPMKAELMAVLDTLGVEHDDMNVLCLGGQIIGAWHARDIVSAFIGAEFSGGEDLTRRVNKLREIELDAARELVNLI